MERFVSGGIKNQVKFCRFVAPKEEKFLFLLMNVNPTSIGTSIGSSENI